MYVLVKRIVRLVPGQSQFMGTFAKQFTKLTAKVGTGRGEASFPATHIAWGGPDLVGYLQLRPVTAESLCREPQSRGNLFVCVHISTAFSSRSFDRAQVVGIHSSALLALLPGAGEQEELMLHENISSSHQSNVMHAHHHRPFSFASLVLTVNHRVWMFHDHARHDVLYKV